MKKPIPQYQVIQNILSRTSERLGVIKELGILKKDLFLEEYLPALDKIFKQMPWIKEQAVGIHFPKEEKDLGISPKGYVRPESLAFEIRWIFLQVSHHKKEIKIFIRYRDEIEHLVLLANYEEALTKLEKLQSALGYSIWYYEVKILIYHLMGETERVQAYVSHINETQKNKKGNYVPLLIHYLYNRCQKNLSAYDYDTELVARFKRKVDTWLADEYSYFLFRLNFYNNYDQIKDLSVIPIFEAVNSLVDRYQTLIYLLRAAFLRETEATIKETWAETGCDLYKKVEDPWLLPFLMIKGKVIPKKSYDDRLIEILDNYYVGEYDKVIDKCRTYILTNSSNFDIVKLYCLSLIQLNKPYEPITPTSDPLLNNIAHIVHRILKGINIQRNTYKLYQLSKGIYDFSISNGIYTFIKEERNEDVNRKLRFMSFTCYDPFFSHFFSEDEKKVEYIEKGLEKYPQSIALTYYKQRAMNVIDENSPVVPYISNMDNAKILFGKQEYGKCQSILKETCNSYRNCMPILQKATSLYFKTLERTNDKQGAVNFYVKEYIENSAVVSKVNTTSFVKLLYKTKYSGIRYNLDFLLFAIHNVSEESDLSFILEQYCNYKRIDPLNGMLPLFKTEDPLKVEDFLFSLIKGDTLRHTTFFVSTHEVLLQIKDILNFLIAMNTPRKKTYESLLQELGDEIIAYEAKTKEEESKIYANEAAIVKYELKSLKPLYDQFQTQRRMNKNSGAMLLVDFRKSNPKDKTLPFTEELFFTDDALGEIAIQLYEEIRIKFLKSKFGLSTYLSTRIRHGVFEGNIRSVFDKHHIIFNMLKDNYNPTPYWRNLYHLQEQDNHHLNDALKEFSRKVDEAIFNFKRDVLQIKISPKDKGELNFVVDYDKMKVDILQAARNTDNFEDFCYYVMHSLWEVAESSLGRIRKLVRENLLTTLRTALEPLNQTVARINIPAFQIDFRKILKDCRTELEQRMYTVANWFRIQEVTFDDFNMKRQFDIVWQVTTDLHPSMFCQKIISKMPDNLILKGKYCTHFNDLFGIFIRNMMDHGKTVNGLKKLYVDSQVEYPALKMSFTNDFDGDSEVINHRLDKLLNAYDKLQKEGGSGLVKAKKIVKYDLGNIQNDIYARVENGKFNSKVTIDLTNIIAGG